MFGMGTGVTPPLRSPGNFKGFPVHSRVESYVASRSSWGSGDCIGDHLRESYVNGFRFAV